MKAKDSWTTYRTRFLVKAKQLTTSLTFTDSLGREHSGQAGDYLVEFSDGVRRIASRQIFEDIYVPIVADQSQLESNSRSSMTPAAHSETARPNQDERLFEQKSGKRLGENPAAITFPVHVARKAQQSVRDHRYPFAGSH